MTGSTARPSCTSSQFVAIQQRGRKPRLLTRHLADRHHLVDWRHVAERKHGLERRVAANLAAFDRNAGAGAGGARDFAGNTTQSPESVDAMSGFRRKLFVAPSTSRGRWQALRQRHARLIAQRCEFRNVGTAARRCRRRRGSLATNSISRPAWAAIRRARSAIVTSSMVPT